MNELKNIPKNLTKSIVIKMYIDQYNEVDIIASLNEIILANPKRNLPQNKTPRVRKIRNCEFKKFQDDHGKATGYKPMHEHEL